MAQNGRREVPAELECVRRRIEAWRRTGPEYETMPESLWAEAAAMATRHGAWWVAQVLRLNHARLKARLAEERCEPERGDESGVVTFVEVQAPEQSDARRSREAVVELTAIDGAKLVIRSSDAVDVLRLAEAFWRRRA